MCSHAGTKGQRRDITEAQGDSDTAGQSLWSHCCSRHLLRKEGSPSWGGDEHMGTVQRPYASMGYFLAAGSWLTATQVLSHSSFVPRGGWVIAWDWELNPEAMVRVCYPPLAPPLAPLALSGLPCDMRTRNTQETPPVSWQDSLLNYRHLGPRSNWLPEDGALRAERDFCPL